MHPTKHSLLVGAALAFLLPLSAVSTAFAAGAIRTDRARIYMAQYDGQPFGPGEDGAPDGGYGGPYGGPGGPYGGYGGPSGGYGMPPEAGPDGDFAGGGPGYPGGGGRRSAFINHKTVERVSYHGFRIDLTDRAASPEGARELAAIEHQIDMMDSAGLSASALRLFRSTPIKSTGPFGPNHSNRGTSVVLGAISPNDARPVLLHEYMHVLHHSRMPGGFENPTIKHFYEEAVAKNLYPPESYMMKNVREFFAVTASCFLHGTVERDPYTREAIRTQQPDYYAFLEQLFGQPRASRGLHRLYAVMKDWIPLSPGGRPRSASSFVASSSQPSMKRQAKG